MNYTGNNSEDVMLFGYKELVLNSSSKYGYMGIVNNAAFYVHKKLWKSRKGLAVVYKEWEEDIKKDHWL